ncbi:MAG: FtsH protease activity modulator HflK [Spirochaetaceae bacterium]|nr:MAG: FtsH protease activity modulator HflK [Spirochaetaceae bacterium]
MSERNVTPPKLPFTIKPKLVLFALIVIAVFGVATTSVFIVDQTEQSVVLLLGEYNRTVGPGLQFKLPFGIESSHNVPTQVLQNASFGFRTATPGIQTRYDDRDYPEESIMLTGDLNIVDVEWIIQFRIDDPVKWLFEVQDQTKTIRDISQSVVNQLVGDRAILDVIGSERSNIELQALELKNDILNSYDLGVRVMQVRLQNIVPPVGRVQDAFEDVNRAVQDMNRLINEGREQYNREIPRTRGQAQRLVQEAGGYATERVNRARGDAARFEAVLGEYAAAPATTRTRLYIEMMEDLFMEDDGTLLIDRELDNFLPLLNLQGGSQ